MHYVYFIQSQVNSSVYVGSTANVERRLEQHNLGLTKSTKHWRPYKLLHVEEFMDKTTALKREIEIKKSWSKKEEVLRKIGLKLL